MILALDEKGLKLGNPPELLPCLCRSVSVGSKLIFDSAKTEGTNGQKYQLKGWEDGDISINVVILGDDKETMDDKLVKIVELFKNTDDSGAPIIYEIDMPILQAWKIHRVFYSGLQNDLTIGKKYYSGSLKFREYKPEIDTIQENKQAQKEEPTEETLPDEVIQVYSKSDVQKLKEMEKRIKVRGL